MNLIMAWDSAEYKDENGNPVHNPGFFDFAAHLLYDKSEKSMNEIGDTMHTVVRNVYNHFY